MLASLFVLPAYLGLALCAFNRTVQTGTPEDGIFGTVQLKNETHRYCYFPAFEGISPSCTEDEPRFSDPMNAHLSQNQSIGYYDASSAFLGGWDFPYPKNLSIVYVCVSGAFSTSLKLYQSLCAIPRGDNEVVPKGKGQAFCMIAAPQRHVQDGCYSAPDDGDTTPTSSASATSTATSPTPSDHQDRQPLSRAAVAGIVSSVVVAVLGVVAAILTFLAAHKKSA